MAEKVDTKNRKLDINQQQCPFKKAATEGKGKFLLSPARYRRARGASQKWTSR
jgi:hypothetical protein